MGKGIKIYATDVIRSVQDHWLGSPVLDCHNLIGTVNQACPTCLSSPDEEGGWGEAFLFGQGSTQMDREASWYCQAHARPDSITVYSSVPYKAQINSLEKYMSYGNKAADGVTAEAPFSNLCYWNGDGPLFKSSCAWYNMSLEGLHPS